MSYVVGIFLPWALAMIWWLDSMRRLQRLQADHWQRWRERMDAISDWTCPVCGRPAEPPVPRKDQVPS